jgi:hypothetical protein
MNIPRCHVMLILVPEVEVKVASNFIMSDFVDDASPLTRDLNAGEKAWLMQNSLICLTARLSTRASALIEVDGALEAALLAAQTYQPYLKICVDTEKLCFKLSECIPLSFETIDTDADENVRDVARAQLAIGVDRSQTFARLHVVKCASHVRFVMLCDHLALDAKSLGLWLNQLLVSLESGEVSNTDLALPFVDWTSRIPKEINLPPFTGVDSAMLNTKIVVPEDLASAPPVLGYVKSLDKNIFTDLKEITKTKGTTLNAPLMTAFFAAVLDVARKQDPELEIPQSIRSVCAVDLRSKLTPPLASDYMNNSASVVPVTCTFEAGTDLWDCAQTTQEATLNAISADEGFRLHDITTRAAFAEMGPIFAIPCLWSNVGHVSSPTGTVESAEVCISGAGSNPVITGHCVEAGGVMALTVTYAPAFHDSSTAIAIAENFVRHVSAFATGDPCPYI